MIYAVVFILGGMFGAMVMALIAAGGTPDDDEIGKRWKSTDELLEDDDE